MSAEDRVELDLTRPSRDGGRDAIGSGSCSSGPPTTRLHARGQVLRPRQERRRPRELSQVISRLRHRQFGVLVTSSYLADQAYTELARTATQSWCSPPPTSSSPRSGTG